MTLVRIGIYGSGYSKLILVSVDTIAYSWVVYCDNRVEGIRPNVIDFNVYILLAFDTFVLFYI